MLSILVLRRQKQAESREAQDPVVYIVSYRPARTTQ